MTSMGRQQLTTNAAASAKTSVGASGEILPDHALAGFATRP